jgi:3-oxoacyl-[acyl-carrier-protein] synthase II
LSVVHVANIGAVTALGNGTGVLWKALMAGRCGLAPVRRFATDNYICRQAGCISSLDAELPNSRLDRLVEMLFDGIGAVPHDTALFTASTKGGIDQLERAVRGQKTNLDRILGHQVVNHVAERLGLKGSRQNISAACASATVALALGAAHIEKGQVESVLVCGLDLVSEFTFSGFAALKALSPGVCRPFDVGRDGLTLGEGAAYVLLMSSDCLRRTKFDSLGRLVGWGIASDAHHVTAPSRTGEGLVLAIQQALAGAKLTAVDLAAISAHGTGSNYNDAMELTAFSRLFKRIPPMHSVKGAIGHTMGACGTIETIVGLCSLKHQCLPPTVGLSVPEERARRCVSAQAQPFSGQYLLTTNSGFGGINACLILSGEAS